MFSWGEIIYLTVMAECLLLIVHRLVPMDKASFFLQKYFSFGSKNVRFVTMLLMPLVVSISIRFLSTPEILIEFGFKSFALNSIERIESP